MVFEAPNQFRRTRVRQDASYGRAKSVQTVLERNFAKSGPAIRPYHQLCQQITSFKENEPSNLYKKH